MPNSGIYYTPNYVKSQGREISTCTNGRGTGYLRRGIFLIYKKQKDIIKVREPIFNVGAAIVAV